MSTSGKSGDLVKNDGLEVNVGTNIFDAEYSNSIASGAGRMAAIGGTVGHGGVDTEALDALRGVSVNDEKERDV